MTPIGRIEREWISYRSHVMPVEAPPVQVQECRRAFYAGAQALMSVVLVGLTPESDPTPGDLVMMGEIDYELKAFVRDVKEGRA